MTEINPFHDPDLRMLILSHFYRSQFTRDRGPPAMCPLNAATGLPESANDLLGRGDSRVVQGPKLALAQMVLPRAFASGVLCRDVAAPGSTKPCPVPLRRWKPSEWTDLELEQVNELEYKVQRLVHLMATPDQGGLFDVNPSEWTNEDGTPARNDFDDAGLTRGFKITRSGLDEANRVVPGTRWATGPKTLRESMHPDDWAAAPDWLKAEESAA